MKKILLAILSILTYVAFGQDLTENRVLENFTRIHSKGIEDIYLTDDSSDVKIVAEEGSLKKIKTIVEDGTLTIYEEKKSDLKGVKLYISAPSITHVKISGAGNLIAKDTLNYENLSIEVTGAGDVDMVVKTNNLRTKIVGAGDVKLSGRAIVHEADIAGAGDLMAMELLTDVTNARVAGAGDIQVNATEELNVNVSGAGDVFYKDEPKKKEIKISGAGDIFSFAPDSLGIPDTTKLKFGNRKLWIIGDEDDFMWDCDTCIDEPEPFKHWAGFELGAAGYLSNNSMSMPSGYEFLELHPKSINYNLNILEKGISLYGEYAKVVSGLGFEFNQYRFENNIALISTPTAISAIEDTVNLYTKNKLNTTYITVPVLLAFNSGENKNQAFHFSAGIVGGYNIGTKYKQKYTTDNKEYKNKIKASYNLLPYRLSARASMGYGNFNIYATYSLTEFFEDNKGPALNPFTIGIRVIPF